MSLLWVHAAQDDREWYHVSPYEFDAGQMVHSPKRSGVHPWWGGISDPGKVYLHDDLEMAQSWAEHSADEHGIAHHVYQVRPHGRPVDHKDRTKDLEHEWTVPHAEVVGHSGYVAHPGEGGTRYHPGLESGDWDDWSEDEDDKYCPGCNEYGHGPEAHDEPAPPMRRNPSLRAQDVKASLHPEVGPGSVGIPMDRIGMVPLHLLAGMHGNNIRSEDRVRAIQDDIQAGIGIREPIIVAQDPETGRARVAEGNHRLHAAEREGISHVPVTMYRDKHLPSTPEYPGRVLPRIPDYLRTWEHPREAFGDEVR